MKKKSQIKLINIFKWLRFEIKNCGGIPQNFPQNKIWYYYLPKFVEPKVTVLPKISLKMFTSIRWARNENKYLYIKNQNRYVHIWMHSFLAPKTYYTTGF